MEADADYPEDGFKHCPFGDAFGTKADYEKGMNYSVRRTFLDESDDNVLRPPPEFMTRKQSLNFFRASSSTGKLASLQNMSYFNQDQAAGQNMNRKKLLKSRKPVNKSILIETYSSVDPKDWVEEFQAGCHMWVNHSSGEVAEVCPWEDVQEQEEEEEDEEGTGAPVYDPTEMNDLFDILDKTSPTKEKVV